MLPVVTGTDVVVVAPPSTPDVVFVPTGAIHARQLARRTPLWALQDTIVEAHRRVCHASFRPRSSGHSLQRRDADHRSGCGTRDDGSSDGPRGRTHLRVARPVGIWRDGATRPTRLQCRQA